MSYFRPTRIGFATPAQPLWHYTDHAHLRMILADGFIKPAQGEPGERSAVWLSTNQKWERTATKALRTPHGRIREAYQRSFADIVACEGAARIGVLPSVGAHDWRAFCTLSGIRKRTARSLARVGRTNGANPLEWFVVFGTVSREYWTAIEMWETGEWRVAELLEAAS